MNTIEINLTKKNKFYGYTWVIVFEVPDNILYSISENDVSYSIRLKNHYMSFSVLIDKDRKESKKIKKLIDSKSFDKLADYVWKITHQNCKAIDIINQISDIVEEAHLNGVLYNQNQIKKSLGL